jgi:FAD/FMN-containing dehydrogenase
MSVAALLAALPDVPAETEPALVRQKSRDFFWYSPVLKRQLADCVAEAVLMPRDEAGLAAVLSACVAHRVPVTPRGAGTGNYGQAMPLAGGIILDLSAMHRLLWVRDGAARAEAGMKLCDLDDAVRTQSGQELRFHPSTRRTATIGGFIAGGSSGIGSITWGTLSEPGNVLGVRLLTCEATPRAIELRGDDLAKAIHAYGTTGIVTEVEIALAPAQAWTDALLAFPSLRRAAEFGDAFARGGVPKKLACVLGPGIVQDFFRPHASRLAAGEAAALVMAAGDTSRAALDAVQSLAALHGGRIAHHEPTALAEPPLYEFTWNHTTLQALKRDRSITYLQTLFPAPDHVARALAMAEKFGDEVPMHLEFVRLRGEVCCFGLQLVRFTTEARLAEIIAIHEDAGCPIFNPHAFTLEEGGMKAVDQIQLAFKREADPHGLLNHGKMLAWSDPDWKPAARTHLFGAAPG